jgi:hypothetical protein
MMTVSQLRKRIATQLKTLSADRLRVASHYIEYLSEHEDNPATTELLKIKGFRSALRRAERQVAQGKTVPLEKVRRDV